jgi:hypothetical protein
MTHLGAGGHGRYERETISNPDCIATATTSKVTCELWPSKISRCLFVRSSSQITTLSSMH